MMILVTGKNNSGKSLFAERLSVHFSEKRYYIATMRPYGSKGAARVQKHILQREGMGFITLELPCSIASAPIPAGAAVLLEDVSNLLSNAMFEKGRSECSVFEDILSLCHRTDHLIAVTIIGFENGSYNDETGQYINSLENLNRRLAHCADIVIEMRNGTPLLKKGVPDEDIRFIMDCHQHL